MRRFEDPDKRVGDEIIPVPRAAPIRRDAE
jgi:hypothetical protein